MAIVNGPSARTVRIGPSFLGAGAYRAMIVRDSEDNAAAVKIEKTSVSRKDSLTIYLRAGGGFIATFRKE